MNTALKTLFALLLAFGAQAHACESVSVTVLPFNATPDFAAPSAEILTLSGGVGRFGVVTVEYSASVLGCNATVGYTNARLYVAKELTRDECSFKHVLAHEQEHVRIYEQALASLPARIQARKGAPSLFNAVVEELYAVKALQMAHDSPEEYDTNAQVCDHRIVSLTRSR